MDLHPGQKQKRTPYRLPDWLKKRIRVSPQLNILRHDLKDKHLHTVCEEARCPNLNECWSSGTATFMILGDVCTRHCGFCSVKAGTPLSVDEDEPRKIAETVALMKIRHVVITCVARDDLPDLGAGHFVKVIRSLRALEKKPAVEILTTDFGLREDLIALLCSEKPDVFNHNIETVERLSPELRHLATYKNSLLFLAKVKERNPGIVTKSGLMLGLGETEAEVLQTMMDLRGVGCEILTIGQYLPPTRTKHFPLHRFVTPKEFSFYEKRGKQLGFSFVASGAYVRSSYHAGEMTSSLE